MGRTRYVVEVRDGEAWRVYRDGQRFREEHKAYRLLDRIVERRPTMRDRLRVSTVAVTR